MSLNRTGVLLAVAAFATTAQAETDVVEAIGGHEFSVSYFFNFKTAGSEPAGGLAALSDGSVVGVTGYTGAQFATVYKIAPDGSFSILHSFGYEAFNPYGAPLVGDDGRLYGVTSQDHPDILWRIDADGSNFVILYTFPADAYPLSSPMQAKDGSLYGTTWNPDGVHQNGTVWRMTRAGVMTTVHTFADDGSEGSEPDALLQASNGTIYGTTAAGGGHKSGTFFSLQPDGIFRVMHSFIGSDGSTPYGALVEADNGSIFGSTVYGGPSGTGLVYRMRIQAHTDARLHVLHAFGSNLSDGAQPTGLARGPDGSLYGTARDGGLGAAGQYWGTVFRLTPGGLFKTLHRFKPRQGIDPDQAALVLSSDGYFYGTCREGGRVQHQLGEGTVFRFAPRSAEGE